MTITHDAFDLSMQEPPRTPPVMQGPPSPRLAISGGQDRAPVLSTCSRQELLPLDIWWLATEAGTMGELAIRI